MIPRLECTASWTYVISVLQQHESDSGATGNCNHRTECAFWVWLLVPLPWLGDERMKGSTDRRIRSTRVSTAVENLHTMVRPSIFTKLIKSLSVSFGFNIASIVEGGASEPAGRVLALHRTRQSRLSCLYRTPAILPLVVSIVVGGILKCN
jgi:hypothetical protein